MADVLELGHLTAVVVVAHLAGEQHARAPVGAFDGGEVLCCGQRFGADLGEHQLTSSSGVRSHLPERPPALVSTLTSVSTAPRSTALIMSNSASPAVATAVSASISTPVRSAVRVVAVLRTPSSVTASSTETECSAIGWQSGTMSGVRLAPIRPAIRATASASPLARPLARSMATTSGVVRRKPEAEAVRAVTSFADTSTIRAAPAAS